MTLRKARPTARHSSRNRNDRRLSANPRREPARLKQQATYLPAAHGSGSELSPQWQESLRIQIFGLRLPLPKEDVQLYLQILGQQEPGRRHRPCSAMARVSSSTKRRFSRPVLLPEPTLKIKQAHSLATAKLHSPQPALPILPDDSRLLLRAEAPGEDLLVISFSISIPGTIPDPASGE